MAVRLALAGRGLTAFRPTMGEADELGRSTICG